MSRATKTAAGVAGLVGAAVVVGTLALTGGSAAWQGSFNASYQAAAPGSTIEVPAGTIVQDFPAEGAVKIREIGVFNTTGVVAW